MKPATDDELIRCYLDGDVEALNTLVERYQSPLFGFIRNMVYTPHDADEVFQEVWFKAIRSIHRFRKGKFLSWLFKIAHRSVIDRVRRQRPTWSLDQPAENHESSIPVEDHRHVPDQMVANQDLGQRIQQAVEQLPLAQKEVFLMRMEADLDFKEIARIQRKSINTVLARMSYALGKLREILADDYQELGRFI